MFGKKKNESIALTSSDLTGIMQAVSEDLLEKYGFINTPKGQSYAKTMEVVRNFYEETFKKAGFTQAQTASFCLSIAADALDTAADELADTLDMADRVVSAKIPTNQENLDELGKAIKEYEKKVGK